MVATRAVLPALDASDKVELSAACSLGGPIDPRWADATVASYDDVVNSDDVDAVYVPLPNGMHLEWVQKAAEAGKHVLCEKPLASTSAEAQRMVEICEANGVQLAEAWMTPFDPRWAEVIRLARAGTVGEVHTITTAFTFTIGPEATSNYRWDPEQGGGALLDVGIYCLGPAIELWGADPVRIDATMIRHPSGVDARMKIELEWPGNRRLHATVSFIDDEQQLLHVEGSTGTLTLPDNAHTGGTNASLIEVQPNEAPSWTVTVEPGDPYRRMLEQFATSLTSAEPWPRPPSDAVGLLELLERIAERASEIAPRHETINLHPVDGSLALHLVHWDPVADRTAEASASAPGIPWLMVHGLASNARLWDGVAELLALAGHPVVAVDLRGHGQSSTPAGSFDVASVAEDLSLLLSALGWDQAAVAGQSWGGNVVLELAALHPEQVDTLVCVDGGTIRLAERWPQWDDCREALAPPPLAGMPLSQIQSWIADSAADWPESGRQGTLHNFELQLDADGTETIAPWLAFDDHLTVLQGLWEHDPVSRYADVAAPTVLIGAVGTNEPADDPDKFAAISAAADAIPTARAVWFAPAHHDVHAQMPGEVAALLRDAITLNDFFE